METILKIFLKGNMTKQSGVVNIQDWGFYFNLLDNVLVETCF